MNRTSRLDDAQRDADTRVASEILARMMMDLRRVLDSYQRLDGDHGPLFLRHISLAAQWLTYEQDLASAILADPDRAKLWVAENMARLELFVNHGGHQQLH